VKASKEKLQGDDVLSLLKDVSKAVVAKGKKTLVFKIKDGQPVDATEQELLDVVLGRSGTLRAPAMRKGKTFYVGFNEGVVEAGL
jgi:arsenate reductase-like glutaredoxin family protein